MGPGGAIGLPERCHQWRHLSGPGKPSCPGLPGGIPTHQNQFAFDGCIGIHHLYLAPRVQPHSLLDDRCDLGVGAHASHENGVPLTRSTNCRGADIPADLTYRPHGAGLTTDLRAAAVVTRGPALALEFNMQVVRQYGHGRGGRWAWRRHWQPLRSPAPPPRRPAALHELGSWKRCDTAVV